MENRPVSDSDGMVVQHIQYLPYGEPFVDQRMSGYNERFTFTGKERDKETGFGYFGARYMDHELTTMWLSVDPMSDKYPGISPYAYCAWNPVRLVDPDGMEIDNYYIFENGYIFKEETNDNTNTYTYIRNDGTEVDLGTYDVTQNENSEDMVLIGNGPSGKNNLFSWAGINSGNLYFEEDAFAGLLGGIQSFYDENNASIIQPVRFNQLMSKNRVHSFKTNRHSTIDIALYSDSGKPGAHADIPADNASIKYNSSLLSFLKKFGLGSDNVFTSVDANGSAPFLAGTTRCEGHQHHMHLQGFKGKVLPLFSITEKKL